MELADDEAFGARGEPRGELGHAAVGVCEHRDGMHRRLGRALLHLQLASGALGCSQLRRRFFHGVDQAATDSQTGSIVLALQPKRACHTATTSVRKLNLQTRNQLEQIQRRAAGIEHP